MILNGYTLKTENTRLLPQVSYFRCFRVNRPDLLITECVANVLHVLSSLHVVEHGLVEDGEEEICVIFSYTHGWLDSECL